MGGGSSTPDPGPAPAKVYNNDLGLGKFSEYLNTSIRFLSKHNMMFVLDSAGKQNQGGGAIHLYTRTTNNYFANTAWKVTSDGRIHNAEKPEFILYVGNQGKNGTEILLINQNDQRIKDDPRAAKWHLTADGVILSQKYHDQCIDISGGEMSNGRRIQIWQYGNVAWQKWWKEPANPAGMFTSWANNKVFTIKAKIKESSVIDSTGTHNTNAVVNTHLYQYSRCNHNQLWKVNTNGNIFLVYFPNEYLYDPSNANSVRIQVKRYTSGTPTGSQYSWCLHENGVIESNAYLGKCIDIDSSKTDNGTQIHSYDIGGVPTNNRLWTLWDATSTYNACLAEENTADAKKYMEQAAGYLSNTRAKANALKSATSASSRESAYSEVIQAKNNTVTAYNNCVTSANKVNSSTTNTYKNTALSYKNEAESIANNADLISKFKKAVELSRLSEISFRRAWDAPFILSLTIDNVNPCTEAPYEPFQPCKEPEHSYSSMMLIIVIAVIVLSLLINLIIRKTVRTEDVYYQPRNRSTYEY